MPKSGRTRGLSEYEQRLRKTDLKVNRDENGDLLPVSAETDSGRKVRVLPLTLGDIKEMRSERHDMSMPIKLLSLHYVEPNLIDLTAQEIKDQLTQHAVQDMTSALIKASGLEDTRDTEEIAETVEESMQEGVSELKEQPRFEYQMHEMGYTAVGDPTYYALTLQEIRRIMEGCRLYNTENSETVSNVKGNNSDTREPTAAELQKLREKDQELMG